MSLILTEGSAAEYDAILYGKMTPEMAAEYLRKKTVYVRSFSQTLRQMVPGQDLVQTLTDFYAALRPEASISSISKNIRNWMRDRNMPSAREDYFCIAFALGLSEAQLNFLLGMCTDYAIQYRSAREAVLAWFLRSGEKYSDAVQFLADLPAAGQQVRGTEDILCGRQDFSRLTHEIRSEFRHVRTKEELQMCYLRNLDRFGTLHLRSYFYFEQYLQILLHPDDPFGETASSQLAGRPEEPNYSIETVMDKYLKMKMPSARNRGNFSLIQKMIKNSWPNATKLKNILNHTEDVPRKVLLLLYVVTENSDYRGGYRESDEEYASLEERVEDHWWTLNAMLTECGMAPLDLRNAFDWLILYAICADGEEAMSNRLEGVIDALYNSLGQEL